MIKPDNGNPVFTDLPPGFTEDCLSTAKYSCVLSQGLSVAGISPAMAEELGLDPEFAIGCSFYDIMGDANKESVAKLKEIADLKKGRIVVDLHYGEDKKIQVEARVLNHGAMSWILLFVNNDSDVENQRKTEPAQDGIIYTKHFDDAADGMTLSTPEGEILAVNRVFLRMLKYPESLEIKLHAVKDNLYVNLQDRERLLNLEGERWFCCECNLLG
jgi:PAS domain-containing protein